MAFLTARRAVMNPDIEQCFQSRNEEQIETPFWQHRFCEAWSSPYALFTGVLIFIYVGTETATSGWIATYTLRLGESNDRVRDNDPISILGRIADR